MTFQTKVTHKIVKIRNPETLLSATQRTHKNQ